MKLTVKPSRVILTLCIMVMIYNLFAELAVNTFRRLVEGIKTERTREDW